MLSEQTFSGKSPSFGTAAVLEVLFPVLLTEKETGDPPGPGLTLIYRRIFYFVEKIYIEDGAVPSRHTKPQIPSTSTSDSSLFCIFAVLLLHDPGHIEMQNLFLPPY